MGSDEGTDRDRDEEAGNDPDQQDREATTGSDPDPQDEPSRIDPDPRDDDPDQGRSPDGPDDTPTSTDDTPTSTDDDRSGDDRSGDDRSGDDRSGDDRSGDDRSGDSDQSGDDDPSAPSDDWSRTGGDGRPRPTAEQSTEGTRAGSDPPSREEQGTLRWLWTTDHPVVLTVREVFTTVLAVMVIGLVLFAVSGVWPPLVAVESGSMEPHMEKGDLVFVMDEDRLGSPPEAVDGVVTNRAGEESGHWSFGDHGNVVVFRPNGRDGTPIIHRAEFWVEEGDDWVAEADPAKLGRSSSCAQVRGCPAPHDGYITKGDDNAAYDQVAGRTTVVKPEWVRGTARVRIPWLGCIRLELAGQSCF